MWAHCFVNAFALPAMNGIITQLIKGIAMGRMHNPPHPGKQLLKDILPALGLNITEAANQLGVSRVALSRLLNARAAVSPQMALRLEAWLGIENGGSADTWMAQQAAYDLWQARAEGSPKIKQHAKLLAA